MHVGRNEEVGSGGGNWGKRALDFTSSWAICVLLLASVSLNVVFGRALWVSRHTAAENADPATGGTVPPLSVEDLQGRTAILQLAGATEPTVLYIFSPQCHWCARNLQNIRTLAQLRTGSYRFIGLSLDSPNLQSYLAFARYGFPIYSVQSPENLASLDFRGTPQTIVVSPRGVILKNWAGAYMDSQSTDVESYFSVKLPGLLDAPGPTSLVEGDGPVKR
jgi:peroxiredoxin